MSSELFETSDFLVAAFLLARSVRMVGSKWQNRGKFMVFQFEGVEACEELVKELHFGDDTVSAAVFFDATKRLKKIIHSRER